MYTKRKTSKENASTLFRRYLWLVELLIRKKGATFKEINEAWANHSTLNPDGNEIVRRTFHNHRIAIEEMFDINIVCDRSNAYIYHIEDELSEERNKTRAWMLNNLVVNNLLSEYNDLQEHILLEDIPSGQNHLLPIMDAIRSRQQLAMSYHGYWKPNAQTLTAEPYCLKLFRQRWYLLALNHDIGEFRIYSLDRIQSLKPLNEQYTIPADFDTEAYFCDYMGVIADHDEDVQTIKIRVYNEQSSYFKSLPLHHSQKTIKETDNFVDFSYYITPTHDFWQALLQYGHKLEILEPQWLRDEFLYIAQKMMKRYKDK